MFMNIQVDLHRVMGSALLFSWLHCGLAAQTLAPTPDPSLKLHFDFEENSADGRIVDVSGNGNDGWQSNPTNWITTANGVFGSLAGRFTYAGLLSNDPPHVYAFSQYIAVTNLTGFAYLTNGTISFWAQLGANGDLVMQVMDTGYPVGYSGDPNAALNSWSLGRAYTFNLVFTVHTAAGDMQVVGWPTDVVRWGGSNPDLSTTQFHLYTVTVDCPNHRAVAYYDGQPYMTGNLAVPWIRIYGSAGQRWLCVGALAHDGTPPWGDDLYPNAGFFVGRMDDVRIYNRTLAAEEVQALYSGNTYARNLLIQRADPQSIQLCWDAQSNAVYQVEFLSSLSTNAWTSLRLPIPGNGAANCIMDSVLGPPTRFYRVRVLP
ncbi:MAG TPA: LamG-like jellyroll fold domain-containing protein [Anaerolineales bacterium]